MRVFLAACLAMVILAVAGYFATSMAQRLSGTVYTTEGARIKQSWTYRRVAKRTAPGGHGMAMPADASNVDDDCAPAAPYCEPGQKKCLPKFQAGTAACKLFGGP